MLEKIDVLFHSSIRIDCGKIMYFDPYQVDKEFKDADFVFITHSHFDHYSEEDLEKVRMKETIFFAPEDVAKSLSKWGVSEEKIQIVKPGDKREIENIQIEAVPAYNVNKGFHPKENLWVGYVITANGVSYYIAGDTDKTEDNEKVTCDVAFVPVGGTYTMTADEAAELVNIIRPKIAVPIHYGSVVGSKKDAVRFVELLDSGIEGKIMMKG